MNNQKGITLIELLAVLVIISIFSLLIINFIISSQRTYTSQQAESFQLAETTIFFNMVLTDIKQNPNAVNIDSNMITINNGNIDSISYRFDSSKKVVVRNGTVVLNGVKSFEPKLGNDVGDPTDSKENNKVLIQITNLNNEKYETIYYLRKGEGDQ